MSESGVQLQEDADQAQEALANAPITESGANANGNGHRSSVLDELRKRRDEVKASVSVDLDIPGYEGLLVARYGALGTRQAEAIARSIQRERKEDRNLIGSMDTLIQACQGIYVREDDDTLRPIDKDGAVPVRFDSRLAELLQFEARSARDVVREVFPSGHAIIRANIVLSKWMQNPALDLSQEMLGE